MGNIIKKKDIKAYLEQKYKSEASKEEKEEVEELVDPEGAEIEGDKELNYDSEITVGDKPQTSDDFEDSALQHRSWAGYGGTAYSRGVRLSEDKIESLIEDIIANEFSDKDFVPAREKILDGKIKKFLKSIEIDIREMGKEEIINKVKEFLGGDE